jgi:ribonuclease HII
VTGRGIGADNAGKAATRGRVTEADNAGKAGKRPNAAGRRDMLRFEREYTVRGFRLIAGCDEAGRGPLAGPVACAAVIMPLNDINPDIDDSKKLTFNKREELYAYITSVAVAWSVVFIDNETIDGINILQAAIRGMEAALRALRPAPDIALIDAIKTLDADCPTKGIIHGDAVSYNIAAASILAKTERDRLMIAYAREYPQYGFERHMGYPTAFHRESVLRFGPCPLHRKTFLKNLYAAPTEKPPPEKTPIPTKVL